MKYPYFIFALCTQCYFHSLRGAEADSISIRSTGIYANPAARFFEQPHAFSEIKLSGSVSRKRDAYIMQEGKGENGWQAEARSWMALGENSRIWGKAAYRNGVRKSVSWNETSDFSLLYPYIMADSVGGNLHGQCYSFSGGYAGQRKRFTWGIQTGYKAEIESRDIDPRPRNVISDLEINVGGTYRISGNYRLGASAGIRTYHQDNDVDFYSTLGNAFIHTMTGLGNTYVRFTGTRASADYKGKGYTATLQFFTEGIYGWRIHGEYAHLGMTRHLKSDDNIPLTEMNDNRLQLSLSYLLPLGNGRIGMGVQTLLADRKGTENLFDSGNGSSYEKIGSRQPYADKQERWEIALFYEPSIAGNFRMRFRPHYGKEHLKMTYADGNNRKMEIARSQVGMNVELGMPMRSSRWTLTLNGAYQPAANNELLLDGMNQGAMKEMYEHNFRTLSACRTIASLRIRGTFPYNSKIELYGEAGWDTEIYRHLQGNNKLELNFGVCF